MFDLFNDSSVLTQLHSSLTFGLMLPALISQIWVLIALFAGPALVSVVYLLVRESPVAAQAIPPMESEEHPDDTSNAA